MPLKVATDPDWHLIVEYQTATAETAKGKAPHTSGAFGQVSVVVSGERLPSDLPTPIWGPSSAGFTSDPVGNGAAPSWAIGFAKGAPPPIRRPWVGTEGSSEATPPVAKNAGRASSVPARPLTLD